MSRRRKKTKSQCMFIHTDRRLLERYGLEYNKSVKKQFIAAIQNGDAAFVEKQSLRISVFDVAYHGQLIRVVYDKIRKEIVTVLPCHERYGAAKVRDTNTGPVEQIVAESG